MFYHGPAQSAAALGGIVGALVGAEAAKGPSGQLSGARMDEKQISVPADRQVGIPARRRSAKAPWRLPLTRQPRTLN